MTKGEIIFIAGIFGTIVLVAAMTLSYHLYSDAKRREAYFECLKVTERIIQDDYRQGIRITSTPHCSLR